MEFAGWLSCQGRERQALQEPEPGRVPQGLQERGPELEQERRVLQEPEPEPVLQERVPGQEPG